MTIGIFADSHDHLDNIRRVVRMFNELHCDSVVFAGDLVSTFAVPPLRELRCPLYGCFGDNEGNKPGLAAGMKIIGTLREAPALYELADGTRVVVAHMKRQLRCFAEPFDVAVYGHSHRPGVRRDEAGRLWINPGETSGWTFGQPTVAVLDTATREARIVPIDVETPLKAWAEVRQRRRPRGANA
jgi:putative phosphoesterase